MNGQVITKKQAEMLAIIDQSELAASTKIKYGRALSRYLATGGSIGDADALAAYAQGLSKSGRGFLKAAVRMITNGYKLQLKGDVTPETLAQTQAALMRIEAVQKAVKVASAQGKKSHTWLSEKQVKALFAACGDDLVGQRDRVVIGLLVGAGLRREEATELRFEHITWEHVKELGEFRTILNVRGKGKGKGRDEGGKWRKVPISNALADALDRWKVITGAGYICRSLGRKKELGESISAVGVFEIVRKVGKRAGFDGRDSRHPLLAPHDARRTFANIGHNNGIPLPQLMRLLGHSSIETTIRYLDLDLNLETTASDFIPFSWGGEDGDN